LRNRHVIGAKIVLVAKHCWVEILGTVGL
jgi:hypothetical protein